MKHSLEAGYPSLPFATLTSSKGDAVLGLVVNITLIARILMPNEVIEIHREIL